MLESLLVFILFNNKQKKLHSISGIRVVYYFSYYIISLLKRKIYLEEMPEQSWLLKGSLSSNVLFL